MTDLPTAARAAEQIEEAIVPEHEGPSIGDSIKKRIPGLGRIMVGYLVIQLIISISNGGFGSSLVPNLIDQIDSGNKVFYLGLITGIAGITSLIAQPVFGLLSDRTRTSWGRRAPWMLAGTIGLALTVAAAGFVHSIVLLAVIAVLALAFFSMVAATLIAVIPDRVPRNRRGVFSAMGGLGTFVGAIFGLIVASLFVTNLSLGFWVLGALLLVIAAPLTLIMREDPTTVPPLEKTTMGEVLRGFVVSPRKYPDFAWVFLARFLLFLGYQAIVSFQLYILEDYIGLGVDGGNKALPIAAAVLSLAIIVSLIPSGIISDRMGRRKPLVIIASIIVAISVIFPIVSPTLPSALISLGVAGIGVGIYLAVDQALTVDVLPSGLSAGKDLGVINIAQAGGSALAPLAAAAAIGVAGYVGLYVLAGVLVLLAAAAILPIKSVR